MLYILSHLQICQLGHFSGSPLPSHVKLFNESETEDKECASASLNEPIPPQLLGWCHSYGDTILQSALRYRSIHCFCELASRYPQLINHLSSNKQVNFITGFLTLVICRRLHCTASLSLSLVVLTAVLL